MPKLTYSPSKGLVISAGTGVDFSAADADMAYRKKVIDGSGGNVNITGADSGAVVFVSGGARTVNLPTVESAGNGFELHMYAASAHAHVLQSGTDDVLQGAMIDGSNGTTVVYAPITNKDSITLANARIGDRIDVYCDGNQYHVTAILNDTATLGTA